MFSLNAVIPGEVKRAANALLPQLVEFDRVRERHTLVVKRFESDERSGAGRRGDRNRRSEAVAGDRRHALAVLREELRPVLEGTPAFEARISGIERFEQPVRGPGPVVYLAIESPGLYRLHRRLVAEFGAVAALEGAAYVPHVTLARGDSIEAARRLCEREIEPIEWTVDELLVWDAKFREAVERTSLPA